MAGELSGILDHVERMNELDLDGVEPTSHVFGSRTCCGRTSRARAGRASGCSRRLPTRRRGRSGSPRRRHSGEPMTDILELTAGQALRAHRRWRAFERRVLRRVRGGSRGRRARRLPVARRARRRERCAGRAPARRADRCEGHLLHRGHRDHGRVADPGGLPAAVHRHGRTEAAGVRRAAARQDEHGRVRDGVIERELGVWPGSNPWDPRARARWLLGRLGRGRGRAAGPVGDRHRHRRLDPPARRRSAASWA